jgi:hypothetical protein
MPSACGLGVARHGRDRVRRHGPIRRDSKFSTTHIRHACAQPCPVRTVVVSMVELAFRARLVPRVRLPAQSHHTRATAIVVAVAVAAVTPHAQVEELEALGAPRLSEFRRRVHPSRRCGKLTTTETQTKTRLASSIASRCLGARPGPHLHLASADLLTHSPTPRVCVREHPITKGPALASLAPAAAPQSPQNARPRPRLSNCDGSQLPFTFSTGSISTRGRRTR